MYRRVTSFAVACAMVLALGLATAFAAIKTTTIQIEGMKCGKCSSSVTKALKATDGVQDVQVSHEKGEAIITYDDQKVTLAKLHEVITNTGFKVVGEKPADGKSE
jgi:copper chaperone CopZ